jgi:hypothetical protein
MRISLPPIGPRYFQLYWGLISSATAILYCGICGYLIKTLGGVPGYFFLTQESSRLAILLYPFVLNSVPLILLERYLRLTQKAAWITSESISQFVFTWGVFNTVLMFASAKDEYSLTKLSLGSFYDLGGYEILAVLMVIWIIISIIQLFAISFKYPKRWLMYSILAWSISYLSICSALVWLPEDSPPQLISVAFAFLILKPGLNGLGLYFSGMVIRKERANLEQ